MKNNITYKESIEQYLLEKDDFATSSEIAKHFGLFIQHASALLRMIENDTTHYCISEFSNGARRIRLSKAHIPIKRRMTRKQQLMRLALFGESPEGIKQ